MPQFVIISHDTKDEGSTLESTKYYTLERRRKFFWFNWLSPLKENGKVCTFATRKDAMEKFKSLKKPI